MLQPDQIMIHIGQNILDVLGSSLVWGLLAVFTSQTDLANLPPIPAAPAANPLYGRESDGQDMSGKDTTSTSTTMATPKMKGMYKELYVPGMCCVTTQQEWFSTGVLRHTKKYCEILSEEPLVITFIDF